MEEKQIIEEIDIEKIFKKKNPGLAKLLPKFLFSYIKRIIHQNEINEIIKKYGHKKGLPFIESVIEDFNISFNLINEDNLPADGKFIMAANHPLGGFDGLILIYVLSRHFHKLKFLVNDLLLNIKNLDNYFVPINKHGKQARESALIIEDTYSSDAQVLTFPAGLVSRRQKGIIKDLEWKKNFIIKAIEYNRDIIPIYIEGRNSDFFYSIANIRKFLRIKSNIEMFYLADETFKQKNNRITMIFGQPIHYETFDNRLSPTQWASKIKEHVYDLNKDPNTVFMI